VFHDEAMQAVEALFSAAAGKTATASGTADSGTAFSLTDASLIGSSTNWAFAIITFGTGAANAGKKRVVETFNATTGTLTWREGLPTTVVATDAYTLTFAHLGLATVYEGDQEAYGSNHRVVVGWTEELSEEPIGIGDDQGSSWQHLELTVLGVIPHSGTSEADSRTLGEQIRTVVRANRNLSGIAQDGTVVRTRGPLIGEGNPGEKLRFIEVRARWMGLI
jgi:hypothetical protein